MIDRGLRLFSPSFVEKASLLVLTAGLSGLLVPIVTQSMAEQRLRERQLFEAKVAREANVIRSQAAFLDRISELILGFELAALKVSYYHRIGDRDQYEAAFKEYDRVSWERFDTIRAEISKARRLLPEHTYSEVLGFYRETLRPLDAALVDLHRRDAPVSEWTDFQEVYLASAVSRTDELLAGVGQALSLSVEPRD